MEKAKFPMPTMTITQGYDMGTHKGAYALDMAGEDAGIDWVLAPFTGVIKKVLSEDFGNWYWFAIDDELRRNSLASEWKTAYLAGANFESIKGDSVVIEGRIDWINGEKIPLPSCPEFYKKNDREGSTDPWLW